MDKLAPVLEEYVYDLESANRQPGTIRNYVTTLTAWSEWLDTLPDPPSTVRDVRKEHISRWLASRHDTEAPDTVLTRHRHLRAFFKWAEREEIVDRNPMATLREPIAPVQPIDDLKPDQLRAILKATKADNTFRGARDYALLLVLADTGLRVGELVGMTLEDVDKYSIKVLGKGRKFRTVAFTPPTGKALKQYLRKRDEYLRHRDERCGYNDLLDCQAVWIGQRGPLGEQAVWTITKTRGEAAGVPDVFPHRMRHTWAHLYRLNGGQEGDLRVLGGWSERSQMLARYGASSAAERALAAHRRVNPLRDVL
jgi:site-specific recombinase XerD